MAEEAGTFREEGTRQLRALGGEIQQLIKAHKKAEEAFKARQYNNKKNFEKFVKKCEVEKEQCSKQYQETVKSYEQSMEKMDPEDPNIEEVETEFWGKIGELDENIRQLDEAMETAKKQQYFPEELGYYYSTGANGVFIGARDFWLQEVRGNMTISVQAAQWERSSTGSNRGHRRKQPSLSFNIGDIPNISHPNDPDWKLKCFPTITVNLNSLSLGLRLYDFGLKGERGSKVPNTKIRELEVSADATLQLPLYYVPASSMSSASRAKYETTKDRISSLEGTWKVAEGYKFELSNLRRRQQGGIHVPRRVLQWVVNLIVPAQIKKGIIPLIPKELGSLLCLTPQKFSATIEFSLSSLPSTILDAPLNGAKDTELTRKWKELEEKDMSGCDHCLPPMCSIAGIECLSDERIRENFLRKCPCVIQDNADGGSNRLASEKVALSEGCTNQSCTTEELSILACRWLDITPTQATALVEAQTLAGLNPPLIQCLGDVIEFLNRYCPRACCEEYAAGRQGTTSHSINTGQGTSQWNELAKKFQQLLDVYVQVKVFETMVGDCSSGYGSTSQSQQRAQAFQLDAYKIFCAASRINRQPFRVQISIDECDGCLYLRSTMLTVEEIILKRIQEYYRKKTGLSTKLLKRAGVRGRTSFDNAMGSFSPAISEDSESTDCSPGLIRTPESVSELNAIEGKRSHRGRASSLLALDKRSSGEKLRRSSAAELDNFVGLNGELSRDRRISDAAESVGSQQTRSAKSLAQSEERVRAAVSKIETLFRFLEGMFDRIQCHGCTQLRGGSEGSVSAWAPLLKVHCKKGTDLSFSTPNITWCPVHYYTMIERNRDGSFSLSFAYPVDSENAEEMIYQDERNIAVETFVRLQCSLVRTSLMLDAKALRDISECETREINTPVVSTTLSGGEHGLTSFSWAEFIVPVVEIHGGCIFATLVKLVEHLPTFVSEMIKVVSYKSGQGALSDLYSNSDSTGGTTTPGPLSREGNDRSERVRDKVQEYINRYDVNLWFGGDTEISVLSNSEGDPNKLYFVEQEISLEFVSSDSEELTYNKKFDRFSRNSPRGNAERQRSIQGTRRQFLKCSTEIWLRDFFEDLTTLSQDPS
eukprot:gb/GECG01003420.1/.p1 GENE.gb/GECG01003420.1/~~gb/GECG01003420.1/.p1  ORF type:complete len:1104 (+),score=142.34 gb/GECG01003420.1/:1-3312(+)